MLTRDYCLLKSLFSINNNCVLYNEYTGWLNMVNTSIYLWVIPKFSPWNAMFFGGWGFQQSSALLFVLIIIGSKPCMASPVVL
ncbi:hypothetical protein BDV36DRAFT_263899 [Aspergillus pseudocaelatus]|uniref:Uncharacterized protein n=1 Tax=Aspergillus pseudocaelatus TaxID=1825620 RepID=A0ABQ6WCM2_9EURO|nr:hypothetical protein BDV36DRAFT_263899 [Aspergillus pseudocaelatus]